MSLAFPLLLALVPGALANPVGLPVADPGIGRLTLGPWLEAEARPVVAGGCVGEGCDAILRSWLVGGRAELALVRGLGLYGDVARVIDRVEETDYEGMGLAWSAGGRGSLRLAGTIHGAVQLGFARGDTTSTGASGEGGENSRDTLQAAVLLVLVPHDRSAFLYGGAQATRLSMETTLTDLATTYTFQPESPASAVLGAELRSDHVGLPWSGRRNHLVAGLEGRAGGDLALSARMALTF